MTDPMTPSDNSGKVMSRRAQVQAPNRSMVGLTYSTNDARALREFVASIRIKGKAPSLSLIARRSLEVYLSRLNDLRTLYPELYSAELTVLEKMVTPVPSPARHSRKGPQ